MISNLLEQLVTSLLASSHCMVKKTTCLKLINNWGHGMRTHLEHAAKFLPV